MKGSTNWRVAAVCALLCTLLSSAALASSEAAAPAAELRGMIADRGGRLAVGQTNVLVDVHGQCRWLDNTSPSSEYFVPLATSTEWRAFIDNAPDSIVRDACCPSVSATLVASDGQNRVIDLPVGRAHADAPLGVQDVSYAFQVARQSDGATWTETVSQQFSCGENGWVAGEIITTGAPPPETPAHCGLRADGATWWGKLSAGGRSATSEECPNGVGNRRQTWDVEAQYRCTNGRISYSTDPVTTRIANRTWHGQCAEPACSGGAISLGGYCFQLEGGGDRLTCENRCAASGKRCVQAGLDFIAASEQTCLDVINAAHPNPDFPFGGEGFVGTHPVQGCYLYYGHMAIYRTVPGQRYIWGRGLQWGRPQTCADWLIGNYAYACPCE